MVTREWNVVTHELRDGEREAKEQDLWGVKRRNRKMILG